MLRYFTTFSLFSGRNPDYNLACKLVGMMVGAMIDRKKASEEKLDASNR